MSRAPARSDRRVRPTGRRLRTLLTAAALTLAFPAVAQLTAERVAPQPKLPQVTLQAGMHVIRAEVAADATTRMRGLMMRESLGPNEGMLFVFPDKAGHCFWMKNTLIPLSIAFIEDDGSIVNIADMNPMAEDSHCAARPVRYALEMEQGWFAKRGLQAGSRLAAPDVFKAPARK